MPFRSDTLRGSVLDRIRQTLRAVWRRMRGGELSPGRAAASVAVGLFIGVLPLFGLHGGLCALICLPLRLDLVVAYAASNISNPLMAPFILLAEVEIGSFLLTGSLLGLSVAALEERGVAQVATQLALGSVVFASLVAPLGAGITWWMVERVRRRRAVADSNVAP